MRTFTQQQLAEILAKHRKWLSSEEGGGRANLSRSDLRGSDLRGCDLRWSDLRGCDLRWSNLSGSNLSGSDLRGSNLSGSNLSGSNLSGSDLRGSNLSGSDLRGCDLSGSNLRGCDLRGSDGLITILTGSAWSIAVGLTHTTIGCQRHTNEQWQSFTDGEISKMHSNALAFWKQWKPAWEIALKNCIEQFGSLHKVYEEKVSQ